MIITNTKGIDFSKRIVCTSGYYDPIHVGHIECLEKSKALGDILIVIVNSDAQAILKKGKPFMREAERLKIVDSLRCVDYVFLAIDKDSTVCESLNTIWPHVFTKGGDRFATEIPESVLCKRLGIQMVDGLGSKIQSSSTLIKDSHEAQA